MMRIFYFDTILFHYFTLFLNHLDIDIEIEIVGR